MKAIYLRSDSRNRVSLTKLIQPGLEGTNIYRANVINGKIILEQIKEEPSPDAWLFEPQNQAILRHVQESLQQKATISRRSKKT
jgi:hypothetical protein